MTFSSSWFGGQSHQQLLLKMQFSDGAILIDGLSSMTVVVVYHL